MGKLSEAQIIQRADLGMAILDGQADAWAEEVNLTAMIKNATSPMGLNSNAPQDVRDGFRARMEAQVYAIVLQAFIEGMYRAVTGLNDERKALARQRRQRRAALKDPTP